jgi:hypothetical protein
MAFNARYLNKLAGDTPESIQLWSYKTENAAAELDTASYFPVGYGLRAGDIVFRYTVTNLGASNEALSTHGVHVVKDVSSTAVDVTDTTAWTVTDTD